MKHPFMDTVIAATVRPPNLSLNIKIFRLIASFLEKNKSKGFYQKLMTKIVPKNA